MIPKEKLETLAEEILQIVFPGYENTDYYEELKPVLQKTKDEIIDVLQKQLSEERR